jgi:hypothetical protein
MAAYGMIWPPSFLQSHIRVFPEGQFCAEVNGRIVGSASSLIVSLNPDYAQHTWYDITGQGLFTNHDPTADSLYVLIFLYIQNFAVKGLQQCCIMQERIWLLG